MRPYLKIRILGTVMITTSLLACRPVLAIGWEEILLLLVLAGFLFGPGLLRLYHFWRRMKTSTKEEDRREHKEG